MKFTFLILKITKYCGRFVLLAEKQLKYTEKKNICLESFLQIRKLITMRVIIKYQPLK